MFGDTIAAISTPIGEGGIALVRVSGVDAFSIGDRCFRPIGHSSLAPSAAPTHTIQYGKVVRHDKVIDEVLLSVLRAPRTVTREDMIEISCHGGILTAKLALDTVLNAGARLATPGEFTKRAFLNGRIDLTQAEAVADLIHARTELALSAANEQLEGKLSQRINQLRDDLVRALAHIEAHIDFPDEDISPDTRQQLLARLNAAISFIAQLLNTATEGRILRSGIRTAIIGRPNAGKSSLLNQLLGQDRAIVSAIAGTTRDTIEETTNIRGLPIVFIDTAGLRESSDVLELEGVRRSRDMLLKADLILHIIDASEPLSLEDQQYLTEFAHKKTVIVRNKIDIGSRAVLPENLQSPFVDVSCTNGHGLEELKDTIKGLVWSGQVHSEMLEVMINSRHQNALERAREAAQRTLQALQQDETLEVVAMELRIATDAIGEIVGKTTTEDLLDSIFSQFCLGK